MMGGNYRSRESTCLIVAIVTAACAFSFIQKPALDAATGLAIGARPSVPEALQPNKSELLLRTGLANTCWSGTEVHGETITLWFHPDGTANEEWPGERLQMPGGWGLSNGQLELRLHGLTIRLALDGDSLLGYYSERSTKYYRLRRNALAPPDPAGRWTGRDDLGESWSLELGAEGNLTYWGKTQAYGWWRSAEAGRCVTFEIGLNGQPYSAWTARVEGGRMEGEASNNQGQAWHFAATRATDAEASP